MDDPRVGHRAPRGAAALDRRTTVDSQADGPRRTARRRVLPGYPHTTPDDDIALHLELTGDRLDRKLVALRSHASQTAAAVDLLGEREFSAWVSTESFVDVAAVGAEPGHTGSPLIASRRTWAHVGRAGAVPAVQRSCVC